MGWNSRIAREIARRSGVDAAIGAIAFGQQGNITREQILAVGANGSAITPKQNAQREADRLRAILARRGVEATPQSGR
jgi:hypothetical protein